MASTITVSKHLLILFFVFLLPFVIVLFHQRVLLFEMTRVAYFFLLVDNSHNIRRYLLSNVSSVRAYERIESEHWLWSSERLAIR